MTWNNAHLTLMQTSVVIVRPTDQFAHPRLGESGGTHASHFSLRNQLSLHVSLQIYPLIPTGVLTLSSRNGARVTLMSVLHKRMPCGETGSFLRLAAVEPVVLTIVSL